jgi:phosphoenolpyruvate synthase/pyruvate phosphate dikinase
VEDAESSFAGQFESVLNVRKEDMGSAYKRVVASKYRHEVLKYALARGFLFEDIAMPVLVMAMVQPAAGLCRTLFWFRPTLRRESKGCRPATVGFLSDAPRREAFEK